MKWQAYKAQLEQHHKKELPQRVQQRLEQSPIITFTRQQIEQVIQYIREVQSELFQDDSVPDPAGQNPDPSEASYPHPPRSSTPGDSIRSPVTHAQYELPDIPEDFEGSDSLAPDSFSVPDSVPVDFYACHLTGIPPDVMSGHNGHMSLDQLRSSYSTRPELFPQWQQYGKPAMYSSHAFTSLAMSQRQTAPAYYTPIGVQPELDTIGETGDFSLDTEYDQYPMEHDSLCSPQYPDRAWTDSEFDSEFGLCSGNIDGMGD